MSNPTKLCLLFLNLLIMLGARPVAADQPIDYMQGLNAASHQRFQSEGLKRDFHIFVRLPEGYDSAAENFPVLYLLDGGHTFPMLASYYRYLVFGGEIPEMIIVGIAYGADEFENGNLRGTDFTAASPERAHYGGAGAFQTFLKGELIPYIEKHYRADPARRIIFGQSLGGQFVLYSAQTSPGLFWGHIASNPALHRNLDFFLDARPVEASGHLFVSSAEDDDLRFRDPAQQWIKHWDLMPQKPWKLKMVSIPGHGHFSAAPEAFRQGLRWLFGKQE